MQDKSTDEKIRKAKSYSTPQVQSYTSKQLLDVLGPAQGYGASFGGDDTNPNPF